jgi:hypothetical protein
MYIFKRRIYNYLLVGVLFFILFNVYFPHSSLTKALWFFGSYLSPSCNGIGTELFVFSFLIVYLLMVSVGIYTSIYYTNKILIIYFKDFLKIFGK